MAPPAPGRNTGRNSSTQRTTFQRKVGSSRRRTDLNQQQHQLVCVGLLFARPVYTGVVPGLEVFSYREVVKLCHHRICGLFVHLSAVVEVSKESNHQAVMDGSDSLFPGNGKNRFNVKLLAIILMEIINHNSKVSLNTLLFCSLR